MAKPSKSSSGRTVDELHATATEIKRRSNELVKQMKELAREIDARRVQSEKVKRKKST
jgi:hypothetical protein